jgi:glycosyltransferase involved in cell wall biosynthesis
MGVSALSLCICTLDRPTELARCLATLHEGTQLPAEVLVSDDSPAPEPTRAVCARYERVRYMRGPGQGLAAKRNQLLDEARGTHILFTDDDVTFPSDFIAKAHDVMARMTPRRIVTGFTINRWADGRSEKIPPRNPDFWGHQTRLMQDDPRSISMNATIFPATLFSEVRFDPRLVYGAEEIDLARHALSIAYAIEYTDEMYTDHHPPTARRDYQTTRIIEGLRLFATTKAYWRYAALAPLQLVGAAVKRPEFSLREAIGAVGLALRLGLSATGGTST